MSEVRASDGDTSKFHLRNELIRLRKAARVLRDPGTTSSWKSSLTSSRPTAPVSSVPPSFAAASRKYCDLDGADQFRANVPQLHPRLPPGAKQKSRIKGKKIFLYNWRSTDKSSSNRSAIAMSDNEVHQPYRERHNDVDDTLSFPGSFQDNLTDNNNGFDSKSDTYLGKYRRSFVQGHKNSCIFSRGIPPVRGATIRKRTPRKLVGSAANRNFRKHQAQQILHVDKNGNTRTDVSSVASETSACESGSWADTLNETLDCCSSEDSKQLSTAPPLLRRLDQENHSISSFQHEDESHTYSTSALSSSSYNPLNNCNPSTVGSCDRTTASFNDRNEEADGHPDFSHQHGCGIPCYWRKRMPKARESNQSYYSPSLSRILQRKGASIFCGSQAIYHRNHRRSAVSRGKRIASKAAQGILPLLTDGSGCSSNGTSEDDLSTRFGELYFEELLRLDGRRWSTSCRSLEPLEKQALITDEEEETPENLRSLSQKYKPMFFNDLIGQHIVAQSLQNAISTGRIAPVYLFQGPRGTGKTSAARIFAAGLNCAASEETKPCGVCMECEDLMSERSTNLLEFDGTDKKAILGVRHVLKHLLMQGQSSLTRYKVFVIDECHLLPSRIWASFLKIFEEPPLRVVFIFITTELDNLPHSILSRCQKYCFNKINDCNIVERLKKISDEENLDVEIDALNLIASIADGSLRDAETMLDQLALLGKRITTSLVNELVGINSDDKMVELLDLALASDTTGTVKKARELMDSGVDPLVLMSQMASLITDLIVGTYHVNNSKFNSCLSRAQTLNTIHAGKLKRALVLLSEAEKQLRVSSERSTWFTATLLQLGSGLPSEVSQSSNSKWQSSKTSYEDPSSVSTDFIWQHQKHGAVRVPSKSVSSSSLSSKQNYTPQTELPLDVTGIGFSSVPIHNGSRSRAASAALPWDAEVANVNFRCLKSDKLSGIWGRCVEGCHSKSLRQLLHANGMLVSISNFEGVLVANVAFKDPNIRSRAERYLSTITDSIEAVLRCNVEVKMTLLSDETSGLPPNIPYNVDIGQGEWPQSTIGRNSNCSKKELKDSVQIGADIERRAHSNALPSLVDEAPESFGTSLVLPWQSAESGEMKEKKPDMPMQRIESIIREQRLETAWLQAVGKGNPGSASDFMPEENQMQEEVEAHQNQIHSMNSAEMPSNWEEDLNHEIIVQKSDDRKGPNKASIIRKAGSCPTSPSFLPNSILSKDILGYESASEGRGCGCFRCLNHSKKGKAKVKQRTIQGRRFSWIRRCSLRKH